MTLPANIALMVDEANDSTLVEHDLARDISVNRTSMYYDEDHTVASRNMLTFKSVLPKTSGNFYGTLRTNFKFTKDIVVTGVNGEDIKVPLIGEASFSLPSGVTPAEVLVLRQKMVALLDNDTVMVPHQTQGQI